MTGVDGGLTQRLPAMPGAGCSGTAAVGAVAGGWVIVDVVGAAGPVPDSETMATTATASTSARGAVHHGAAPPGAAH